MENTLTFSQFIGDSARHCELAINIGALSRWYVWTPHVSRGYLKVINSTRSYKERARDSRSDIVYNTTEVSCNKEKLKRNNKKDKKIKYNI